MKTYRTVGEFEKQESVMIIWPHNAYATNTLNNDIVSVEIVKAIINEIKLMEVFNLKQIIWVPKCSYDDDYSYCCPIPSADGSFNSFRAASANGHIDEICRFTSEDTILIAYISDEEAKNNKLHSLNKERLDKAFELVKNAKNFDGKPFNILKTPVPEPIYININPQDDAYTHWHEAREVMNGMFLDGTPFPPNTINVLPAMSYCNFLIANNVVVAQKYYEEGMSELIREKDEESLKVLKSAFPNHHIVQVNSLALNLYGGGIHCHTRNIPVATIKP
ncbi:agmatine deiminase family protein [Clostridium tetanomorphum]|uniref:Agmatine deiminase family protein n=1 Tax=Clostridium tetanomorphum TaxID=1553 RepID=A0A923ECY3_CLOTT|nr:agmatine deiminase family protein [Clostridium tetanomorphum]MBC2399742.1 agmatine deiminase family protein [Clostridium tetanomorphum]NRZ96916.1 agmatine deiminase [Clostridium tetanomorphum]